VPSPTNDDELSMLRYKTRLYYPIRANFRATHVFLYDFDKTFQDLKRITFRSPIAKFSRTFFVLFFFILKVVTQASKMKYSQNDYFYENESSNRITR